MVGSTVSRYTLRACESDICDAELESDSSGDYVDFSDYEDMEEERDVAVAALEELRDKVREALK